MIDFLIFYMLIGYAINNIIALIAIYGEDDDVEIDFTNFILTIPIWPMALFQTIAAIFSKDE